MWQEGVVEGCGSMVYWRVWCSNYWSISLPQTLNEPGEDSTRFDQLMPATVTCPASEGVELGILKQFPFSSDLQVCLGTRIHV